jgi:hypothetical protein
MSALQRLAQQHNLSTEQAAINLLKGLVFPLHHLLIQRTDLPFTMEDFFETLYPDSMPALAEINLDDFQQHVTLELVLHRNTSQETANTMYDHVRTLQQMAKAKMGGAS